MSRSLMGLGGLTELNDKFDLCNISCLECFT